MNSNNKEILSTLLFYFSILFFIIGFNINDYRAGNWYQQFMPNLNGASITDITFTDSLNGYAVTSLRSASDSSCILKTTNSGDNWNIVFMHNKAFVRIEFINANTGFTNAYTKIFKTTDAGLTWNPINLPTIFGDDMFVLNENTIWLAMSEALTGGIYFTSNGGGNWTNQLALGNQNPSKIYMFDGNLGFVSRSTGQILYITTNSGVNWTTLPTAGAFTDMYFANSLTGWKSGAPGGPGFRKTTDGGWNWFDQALPSGGNIVAPQIEKLSGLNKDTIWGTGAQILTGIGIRGMVNRTINGGTSWLFQVPDSSYNNPKYEHVDFSNKLNGWAYLNVNRGIHTTAGGDPIWLTEVNQISTEIPKEYKLYQNYPNPFNPATTIRFKISKQAEVNITVYDIQGRKITELVNKKLSTGDYETVFKTDNLSSGVYFYSLIIDNKIIDTKKMLMIK